MSERRSLPPHERPFVTDSYDTVDLPPTPQRNYRIPASGWNQATAELLKLGDDLGEPVEYKRRIGRYLLWRAGPPIGDAWYLAVREDLSVAHRFRLRGKHGEGTGADGLIHERFRTWKQSLLAETEVADG